MLYERKNALNKTSLMRKIVRLKYIEGESIVVHISTFMGLVNQLASTRFPLDDAMHAILLLYTLPECWENLIVSLSASCKEDNLSRLVVKTSILNEERRRKDKSALSEPEATVAQNLGRGRSRYRGVSKIETSLIQGQSPEEDSRVSIMGNLVISKGIVNTLTMTKALLMMNLVKFMMIKTLQPLQPVRKSYYSFVNKLM